MNDDTDAVADGILNDEFLYSEAEKLAGRAAVANDADEFREELAESLRSLVTANRDLIPDFSYTDPIEYENVDYGEIAGLYDYDEYR